VIRTVSGCTITLCKRPAVTSVIAASRPLAHRRLAQAPPIRIPLSPPQISETS
jgi:hypothetical protein